MLSTPKSAFFDAKSWVISPLSNNHKSQYADYQPLIKSLKKRAYFQPTPKFFEKTPENRGVNSENSRQRNHHHTAMYNEGEKSQDLPALRPGNYYLSRQRYHSLKYNSYVTLSYQGKTEAVQ